MGGCVSKASTCSASWPPNRARKTASPPTRPGGATRWRFSDPRWSSSCYATVPPRRARNGRRDWAPASRPCAQCCRLSSQRPGGLGTADRSWRRCTRRSTIARPRRHLIDESPATAGHPSAPFWRMVVSRPPGQRSTVRTFYRAHPRRRRCSGNCKQRTRSQNPRTTLFLHRNGRMWRQHARHGARPAPTLSPRTTS